MHCTRCFSTDVVNSWETEDQIQRFCNDCKWAWLSPLYASVDSDPHAYPAGAPYQADFEDVDNKNAAD